MHHKNYKCEAHLSVAILITYIYIIYNQACLLVTNFLNFAMLILHIWKKLVSLKIPCNTVWSDLSIILFNTLGDDVQLYRTLK